jgi:peptide/nickel transport system ATP-binding protein
MTAAPLLAIDDLHVEFQTSRGRLRALNGVSLNVEPGEIFGVVGETGCGKTITGLSVLRLLPKSAHISAGRIRFDGLDLLALRERDMRDVRGRHIAMIFQDPSTALNPVFTIGSQIERVVRQHLRLTRAQARRQAADMLAAVGLPDGDRIGRAYPHQMSGGMKQRAMIALALSCRPSLLIADEPTTALDVTIQAQILSLLHSLRKEFGIAVILITHNLGVVAETCDRLAVLYAGRVIETGPTAEVFQAPQHPYTQGLLQAIPQAGSRGRKLTAIPGSVPADPGRLLGCAFASRCPSVLDRCRQERPRLTTAVMAGHESACFLEPVEVRP